MIDPIAPLRSALSGRYDIEREIGHGESDTVYLATDLKHDRAVAIKVLPPFGREGNWKRALNRGCATRFGASKGRPRWLDETIAKTLARNPDDRFQDARDLAEVLSGPSDSRRS
jgi:serine/threonine protein kinase